jgi:DNA repair protein RAD5
MYYGNSARSNLKSILCENVDPDQVPNVVITSYGTLIAEHGQLMKYRQGKSKDENWEDDPSLSLFGLYGVKFYRVVLDEGHTIKNRNTKTSKSCYDLRAERRWVLTGTPIVNKLEDLFSLVKFLRVEPWNNFSFWKAFITTPFQSKGYVQALKVVQSILEPLVLRRTKDMKQADGTPLVKLPPKTVSIQRVKFTDDERALYSWIFARVQSSFNHSLAAGSLMKSYTTILAQIMRLRQVCCHPTLVSQAAAFKSNDDLEEVAGSNGMTILNIQDQDLRMMLEKFENPQAEEYELQSYGTEVMKSILEGAEHECPICTTEPIAVDQQAVTECWHMSCLDCILSHIEVSNVQKKYRL